MVQSDDNLTVQALIAQRFTQIHHRQLLVISGAEVWCLNQIEQILNAIPKDMPKEILLKNQAEAPNSFSILTCNADLPENLHFYAEASKNNQTPIKIKPNNETSINIKQKNLHKAFSESQSTPSQHQFKTPIENQLVLSCDSTNNQQYRQHLGREYDFVIYNAWRGFRANALAGLSGTIKKNGLLLLLCPSFETWPHYQDDELSQRISFGQQEKLNASYFIQYLIKQFQSDKNTMMLTESGLQGENIVVPPELLTSNQQKDEQNLVIEKIKKVARGHRKRPLVITADRGRGKTAALGIAVAQVIQETPRKVLITAPQKSSVETLFRHALLIAPNALDHLTFAAVDDLTLNLPETDILIIDEAAGIPVPQLQILTQNYHRIVFTTTVAGYEGSGRGFEVRFKPWLAANRPEVNFARLDNPFRWYSDDCLETFWWQTLHLKRKVSLENRQTKNKTAIEIEIENKTATKIAKISKQQLFNNDTLLNAAFSLLVDAHYQTTPDDFVALLDAPEQHLFAVFLGDSTPENLTGVLTGNIEGQFNDDKLAHNIVAGHRRVQGHMLPQQLAYGSGDKLFLFPHYFRVIRIAVCESMRSKGLGTALISQVCKWCREESINYIGSSFGATHELLSFWLQSGFKPVLLGFHRDKATAEFNITVLKSISDTHELISDTHNLTSQKKQLSENLLEQLNFHLRDLYQNLDNQLLVSLLQSLLSDNEKRTITIGDKNKISLFCQHNRSLELTAPYIAKMVMNRIDVVGSSVEQLALLLDFALKNHSGKRLVTKYKLKGKKQLLQSLREQTVLLSEL